MAARELTRAEQHLLGPKKKGRTGAKVRKIIPDRDDPRGFNVLGAYASFIQQASQASPPHLMHGRTTLTACTRSRSRLQPRTHNLVSITASSPLHPTPFSPHTVHCFNHCGVVYSSPTRDDNQQEWSKTLRRLNAHESKRCSKRDMNKHKRPKRKAEAATVAAGAGTAAAKKPGKFF